jgi:hypothetical protein
VKQAILDWLTHPNQAAALKQLHLAVRAIILGPKAFNKQRLGLSMGIVALWMIALLLSRIISPNINLYFAAVQYFDFAITHPAICLLLVALTVIFLLIVIAIFDFLLSWEVIGRSGLVFNLCWLGVAYLLAALVALFLARLCAYAYALTIDDLRSSIVDPPWVIAKQVVLDCLQFSARMLLDPAKLARLVFGSIQFLISSFTDTFDGLMGVAMIHGALPVTVLYASLVIYPMLTTSIFALTILNVAYVLGLILIRVDFLVREKYGFDQEVMLKEPVEYLGRVACCMAALLVIFVNLAAVGLAPASGD